MDQRRLLATLTCLFALAAMNSAQVRVGSAPVIAISPTPTAAENRAAKDLATTLSDITGVDIRVRNDLDRLPENSIAVGSGPWLPSDLSSVTFGEEEFLQRTIGNRLYVLGGRPRGVLYGVYRLLQERCGVRWWTPWATLIPKNRRLVIPKINQREKPAFESRDPFWFHAFDAQWAAHNFSNGQSTRLDESYGGKLRYRGFVHTFYELVTPSLFGEHPEWFSLINGKRTTQYAQLCTTNPELRDYVVARVRDWLKENPNVNIVSVSQNDWYNPCQCERCQALAKAEGSESAPVLALANYVAERIEKDYPKVAIDTLAYQYTRKAPKTLKPRPNVIVRLCSIECNFAKALTDPSNASFATDNRDWSRLTDRLYIWDYTTNFPHYVQPFPNYFVLGDNLRFFQANGVKGVFEQGAYQSFGSEMAELRAWVLAQLLWNPQQDEMKLVDEFLKGYYGSASKPIRQYLDMMAREAAKENMTIWSDTGSACLSYPVMKKAEELWQSAEALVRDQPDLLWRVRVGHLPIRFVWLSRWQEFRRAALRAKDHWPMPVSRRQVSDQWFAVATGPGPQGWSPMTHLSESGLTPQAFVAQFAVDPTDPVIFELPKRPKTTSLPKDIQVPPGAQTIIVQDNLARLWREGEGAELRPDPLASDGIACWMPGTHHEWAFQIPFASLPKEVQTGAWRVYICARTETAGDIAQAFTAGIWDSKARKPLSATVSGGSQPNYKSFDLGVIDSNSDSMVWAAPVDNKTIRSIWIDRLIFVKEPRG